MIKLVFISLVFNLSQITKLKNIYTFSPTTDLKAWRIVNDGVMGGISKSALLQTETGYGKFTGNVSLANNGGFASIQLNTSIVRSKEQKFIVLRVKGDGKNYEFRLKGTVSQAESYVHPFKTSGEWETIRLPINEFYPQFRGRRLERSNFNFERIEQISFLIANKKEEQFELLIDSISLE
jgi:hypothetical protein